MMKAADVRNANISAASNSAAMGVKERKSCPLLLPNYCFLSRGIK